MSETPSINERRSERSAEDEQERDEASETIIVDVPTELNENEQVTGQEETEDREEETCPACGIVWSNRTTLMGSNNALGSGRNLGRRHKGSRYRVSAEAPNDEKLSDSPLDAPAGKAGRSGAVRCSAWLGDGRLEIIWFGLHASHLRATCRRVVRPNSCLSNATSLRCGVLGRARTQAAELDHAKHKAHW